MKPGNRMEIIKSIVSDYISCNKKECDRCSANLCIPVITEEGIELIAFCPVLQCFREKLIEELTETLKGC